MSRYTPGPWIYESAANLPASYFIFAPGASDTYVAKVVCREASCTEAIANAKMIAAAPKLLEALDELVSIVEDVICSRDCSGLDSFTLQPARAALAKARGEA